MHKMRRKWIWWLLPVGVLIWLVASIPLGTRARIKEYAEIVRPGMSISDLKTSVGAPDVILRHGDKLDLAHRYEVPELDSSTAIYFYSKEGFPYYNLFVFVNEGSNIVTELVIDRMN